MGSRFVYDHARELVAFCIIEVELPGIVGRIVAKIYNFQPNNKVITAQGQAVNIITIPVKSNFRAATRSRIATSINYYPGLHRG